MAIYFNIFIPVDIFLDTAAGAMSRYGVKMYVEKASVEGNMMRRYTLRITFRQPTSVMRTTVSSFSR